MLKKFYLLLLVLAAGCQSGVMDYETCPRVQIIRDNAYLTQVVNIVRNFRLTSSAMTAIVIWIAKSIRTKP